MFYLRIQHVTILPDKQSVTHVPAERSATVSILEALAHLLKEKWQQLVRPTTDKPIQRPLDARTQVVVYPWGYEALAQ